MYVPFITNYIRYIMRLLNFIRFQISHFSSHWINLINLISAYWCLIGLLRFQKLLDDIICFYVLRSTIYNWYQYGRTETNLWNNFTLSILDSSLRLNKIARISETRLYVCGYFGSCSVHIMDWNEAYIFLTLF